MQTDEKAGTLGAIDLVFEGVAVTRRTYASVAGVLLVLFLFSKAVDLDLGYFGVGLLIIASVFGLLAMITPPTKIDRRS